MPLTPAFSRFFDGQLTPVTGSQAARLSLDVIVTRSDVVESRHRVHAAIVNADGQVIGAARDPYLQTWWRSCAKPFQVMPLVSDGGLDRLRWGDDELALACASHGGEPEHVAIAESMLNSIGLEEGDLACGPHEPLAARGARILRESGHRVSRLHNNCSGKHAAMLARAVCNGLHSGGYERHDHPVQVMARRSVSDWAGVGAESLGHAIDGCGVPVFMLPLANMALAFARLAAAAASGQDAPARVVNAMTSHPFLIGGTDRFDTAIMEATDGRVLCKIGAEGVHTLAIVHRGIGMALKVEDGAPRAQYPAVLAMLAHLRELPETLPDVMRDFTSRAVRNTRGEVVGEIRVGDADVGEVT